MNNEKKIVLQKRLNSLFAWGGVFSTALLAVGYDWHNFQSWEAIYQAIRNIILNPAMVAAFIFNIASHFNNPTNKSGF